MDATWWIEYGIFIDGSDRAAWWGGEFFFIWFIGGTAKCLDEFAMGDYSYAYPDDLPL